MTLLAQKAYGESWESMGVEENSSLPSLANFMTECRPEYRTVGNTLPFKSYKRSETGMCFSPYPIQLHVLCHVNRGFQRSRYRHWNQIQIRWVNAPRSQRLFKLLNQIEYLFRKKLSCQESIIYTKKKITIRKN